MTEDVVSLMFICFFFSSRRRHTRCALVTGVQTCALPIYESAHKAQWRGCDDRARMPARVLCVTQAAELGGAEYALLRIARRLPAEGFEIQAKIGRASCRERGCQYG